MILHINVSNEIARYQARDGAIVCNNTVYKAVFAFDSSWDGHDKKTARFIWNNAYKDVDIVDEVIDGETVQCCEVPKIIDATEAFVGVYADDVHTTTDARIPCVKSILSRTSVGQPEQVQEYRDEAAQYADKAAQHAAEAEASVSEAQAAADRAAEEASTAAAESVAAKAEEMIGDLGIVQNLGDSPTAVIAQKGVTDAIDGLALKGSASGKVIRVDDVAPGEYPVKVKVRGKNLLEPNNTIKMTSASATYAEPQLTIQRTNTNAVWSNVYIGIGEYEKFVGKTLTVSLEGLNEYKWNVLLVALDDANGLISEVVGKSVGQGSEAYTAIISPITGAAKLALRFVSSDNSIATAESYVFKNLQVELGDTATDYEPYVDPSSVTVTRYGATTSENSQTYTPNADGTVDGVLSLYPVMHLVTDNTAAILDVEYIKGTKAEFEKLKERLAFPYAEYGVPVVYFEGDTTGMDKDNAVTLNYRYGDRSGTCTLKWQGSSSIVYPKKNYTVKFDNAFEAVEGWGAQKKYCLKADWVDFSHCRNVVSAKLWGDVVRSRATSDLVTRLSALPNCGAIDGFPCFVVINGEWKGIYNFNIPKDGWMMGMGSGTKEAIICAEADGGQGRLFEAEALLGTDYDLEYSSDGWAESEIQESLNRLIRAVMNSDGSDIDTTIAQYLDIDSAIDYMIFAKLIDHQDGIGNNCILATYDGVKWFFSAYDMDVVFGGEYGAVFNSPTFDTFVRRHKLFNLLHIHKKEVVIDRYKELVKGVMAKSKVDLEFTNYSRLIPLPAYIADAELLPNVTFSSSANNINQVMNWYGERVKWCDEVWCAEMETNIGTRGLTYSENNCTGMGTCREPNIKVGNSYAGTNIKGVATGAFENNLWLESITLPEMVDSISKNAFRGCTYLKEVVFLSEKAFIGNEAFRGCTSLTKVTIPTLFDLDMPLGAEVFNGCTNLARVVLPSNIKKIPSYIFWNCTSLKDIFFSGTTAEWETLEKGTNWNLNTGAYTVHCTDGDIPKA